MTLHVYNESHGRDLKHSDSCVNDDDGGEGRNVIHALLRLETGKKIIFQSANYMPLGKQATGMHVELINSCANIKT